MGDCGGSPGEGRGWAGTCWLTAAWLEGRILTEEADCGGEDADCRLPD